MLVLLPPSEGKASGVSGRPLDLSRLSLPSLTQARTTVTAALAGLCSGDGDKAMRALGLTEGLRGEIARNAGLLSAPTLPVGKLYTGVLYDALGLGSLDTAAKRRAARWLLVCSGLWGGLRLNDRVPAYRCPMGARLPGLGPLAGFWREPMAAALPEAAGRGLVLDLRSSAYSAVWRPSGELASRTATVRVVRVTMVNGQPKRTVVSHFNKATKGRLVRDLLVAGDDLTSAPELVDALRGLGYPVDAEAPSAPGRPWALDVLVTEP